MGLAFWGMTSVWLLQLGLSLYLVVAWSRMRADRDAARSKLEGHERRHRQDKEILAFYVRRLDLIHAAMRDYVPTDFDPEAK